jgi:hypothetical protein
MKNVDLTQLSNEELLQEQKKRKPNFIVISVVICTMIIMAILNTIASGIGVFTFFPIIFLPIAINHWKNYKSISNELKSRNF